jgi:hypothetical protein
MEQISLDWDPGPPIYTVTDLTSAIRTTLANSFTNLQVAGEISGVTRPASGHLYFTLKDAGSQIRCVCYKTSVRWLRFKPQEGIEVVARGRIDVYEPRGEYQLIVDAIEPRGFGALQIAFEQLKRKLEAEGLFARERKRALPLFPRRIGSMCDSIRRRCRAPGRSSRWSRESTFSRAAAGPRSSSSAAAAGRSKICGPSTRKPGRAPSPLARRR